MLVFPMFSRGFTRYRDTALFAGLLNKIGVESWQSPVAWVCNEGILPGFGAEIMSRSGPGHNPPEVWDSSRAVGPRSATARTRGVQKTSGYRSRRCAWWWHTSWRVSGAVGVSQMAYAAPPKVVRIGVAMACGVSHLYVSCGHPLPDDKVLRLVRSGATRAWLVSEPGFPGARPFRFRSPQGPAGVAGV
jgi:hypothetical protein